MRGDHEIYELSRYEISRQQYIEIAYYLPSGGLAAFVHPPAGEHDVFVWAPNAVHKNALGALRTAFEYSPPCA